MLYSNLSISDENRRKTTVVSDPRHCLPLRFQNNLFPSNIFTSLVAKTMLADQHAHSLVALFMHPAVCLFSNFSNFFSEKFFCLIEHCKLFKLELETTKGKLFFSLSRKYFPYYSISLKVPSGQIRSA
jgi:hypothetical protein